MTSRRPGRSVSRRLIAVMLLSVTLLVGAISLMDSHIHWDIMTVAAAIALTAAAAFIVIVRNRISKPVRGITVAAERISRGDLDAELGAVTNGNDEIAVMAAALNDMMEQLRVNAVREAQAQAVTAVRLQFGLFVWEANSVSQAFRMALAVLRYQYEFLRITAVYASPNPSYSLIYSKDEFGGEDIVEAETYPHHAEVTALAVGKKLVYLNALAIKEQDVRFAGEGTQTLCVVPMTAKEKLFGYIILESPDRDGVSITREEAFLMQTAEELAVWISTHKGVSLSIPGTHPSAEDGARQNALSALREFEDLDVESALEAMGGLEDLYERTVRLFARLLPDTLKKTDEYLGTDMKAFAIEIHGIKGSLNNIGAELGHRAAWIEKAAKSGDTVYCLESYPRFKEQLLDFHGRILDAMPNGQTTSKKRGDRKSLSELLGKVKEAADGFDTFKAKDALKNVTEFSYDTNTDKSISDISAALERFDCESAAKLIDTLRETM